MIENKQPPETSTEKSQKSSRIKMIRWLTILFVVGLTIYLLSIADQIEAYTAQIPNLGWFAYPAIFGVSIAANATIIIPLPGVVLTSIFGSIFNPWGVAIAAGLGASLGELSGYLAGFSGQGIIEQSKWKDRLYHWMNKNGNWTILVLAFIPNPLFDMAGMIAGALKIRVTRFLFWCAIGKVLKMMVFAFAGEWLSSLF